ncbi:MAG: UDP-N-acetylmuramoyl-L-alanyl-D-glutamate--2,6-diaminopimelate ligase [Campylobacterales bacterium]|nr:UDP-N-acetylmuramoyl-L-alanyl-D-glutamate--2,6-diaminopimelate ligase [Campylobacterales bacterium]
MKITFNMRDGFSSITDDTTLLDNDTLFLKTTQNTKYFDALATKPPFITPKELISLWEVDSIKIIGITGTNGKTTVSAAIYSILLDLGEKVGLQGTRGLFVNDKRIEERSMTTPSIMETLHNIHQAVQLGATYFVMEVSSHAIDQNRIEGINFAIKVHTNVTQDHLDYHGSIEEYQAVKSRFFADESLKLLNKDALDTITYNAKNAYSYGVDKPASFKVQAFSLLNGITAGITYFGQEATFYSPMMGLFNLSNLLAAIGAVELLTKKPLQVICDAVEGFAGVSGRMEVVSHHPTIIVDFAHTPDGMLQVLDSIKDRDISVVFGAGGNRDHDKRPKMGAVAAKFANKLYVTSDNPRDEKPEDIISEILAGIKDQSHTRAMIDRTFAIFEAIRELGENDVLMILGKGDEPYQEIAGVKHPYDDREVVRAILADHQESSF